jgi:S1-C subfamily serine protease
MAEALTRSRRELRVPLVVGVMGSEHLRHRNGVPHQLADLGVADAAVLLPHDRGQGCSGLVAGEADAVFVLDRPASPSPRRPRLGVELAARDGEVRAMGIVPGSVAEASGLRRGDVILEAGGRAITDQEALVGIVRGTAPGTWLPLLLRRDERTLEAIAKFPREEADP